MQKISGKRKPKPAEDGMTLVELIVAASIMVVITGAAVSMLISSLHSQREVTERADQVGTARVAMEKLLREIRQGVVGTAVVTNSASASQLALQTYVDGNCGATKVATATKCSVTYTCTAGKCTKTSGGQTSGVTIVQNLTNSPNVFEAVKGPSPCTGVAGEPTTYVGLTLEFRTKDGRGSTVLQDGTGLRSCS